MTTNKITNKQTQLNEGHSMNHEQKQEEVDRRVAELAGLIADQALVTHTEMVAAGELEESSDPLVMFRCGVAHGVSAMRLIQEEHATGER